MAIVRPICCIHPEKGFEREIAALPYDVYNRAEARMAVQGKPLSFLNIDRPETLFAQDQNMYAPEVYQAARKRLWQMVDGGSFVKEERPVYYVYELTMDGCTQTGIVACASIDDYRNRVIKKHENTRPEKEQDRICHVDVCGAQTGPIFLAYRSGEEIRGIVSRVKETEPDFAFTADDGIGHAGWKIADPETIAAFQEAFARIGSIYIADGHHRAASAVKVGFKRRLEHPDYDGTEEFNYFLSVLFPEEELRILPYNRVVRDLNGLGENEFLEKVAEKFRVDRLAGASEPTCKGQMSMYLHGCWYRLTERETYIQTHPVEGLDVEYLQRELLAPVLGITDPKNDSRIDFVGGIRGIRELERRAESDMELAFALYPTSIQELFAVADAGLLMPPKSTWFEPKLRSGLFIHEI